MSKPGPVLSPGRPSEPVVYRPVSGLAIASLVIAAIYAVVIVILVVVAFASHTPLFLASWTFLLPVAAVGLAVTARQQIQRSEGTRTGTALATWALWLALMSGLGYGAFYFGTYVAVVRFEAQRFTNDFFDKLRNGKIDDAFLMTRRPEERAGNNDMERMRMRFGMGRGPAKSELASFQDHDLVRVLRAGGPATTITPLGIKSWEYTEGGYQVVQTYRITTSEGMFEVVLTVRGGQGREVKRRQWHVVWNNAMRLSQKQLTPLGEAMEAWPQMAAVFARQWLDRRNPDRWATHPDYGLLREAYLDTRERRQRAGLRKQYQQGQALLALAGITAPAAIGGAGPGPCLASVIPAVDHELGQEVCLPGYHKFITGDLIRWDPAQFDAPNAKLKRDIPEAVRRAFRDPMLVMIRPVQGQPQPKVAGEAEDRLQVSVDVELGVAGERTGDHPVPKYQCRGTLVLESNPGPITVDRRPRWRVVRLDLLRGGPPEFGRDGNAPPDGRPSLPGPPGGPTLP
ncbi:MAG TPA: hypothetical protein VG013_31605 [Gemmataceae bacterium]|jgi:hypothetical protein|nr:hypothetical protein [Gemmataceae bacterium]